MPDGFDFSKLQQEIKFDKDPIPENRPAPKKSAPTRPVGRPTKEAAISQLQKDMQQEIEGFLMLIGMTLTARDQHIDGESSCGDLFIAFNQDKMEIIITPEGHAWAVAFAKVGVENKFLRKFFETGDGVAKWIQLALATQPFIVGIAASHVRQKAIQNA